jgi:hypothetical protein
MNSSFVIAIEADNVRRKEKETSALLYFQDRRDQTIKVGTCKGEQDIF